MREIRQHEIWRLAEGGGEARSRAFCLVLSPDEMNERIGTVIVAPMTLSSHGYPTRVPVRLEAEDWWIVLDQIATLSREALAKRHSLLGERDVRRIKAALLEMLIQ